MDCVLYEFESEPILFICKNNDANLYFCVCTEIRGFQRWIVVPIAVSTLPKLAKRDVDLASVISNSMVVHIITIDANGDEYNKTICGSDVSDVDLPKSGTFLRSNKEDLEDYLCSGKT